MIVSEVIIGLSHICPWLERVCLHLIPLIEKRNAFHGKKGIFIKPKMPASESN